MFFLETMEIGALKLKVKDFLCNMQRCNTSLQNHSSLSEVYLKRGNKKEKIYSAFYSFLYSHTFFTCTRVAVYSAHAWRHSLHGQPERYRGLCPATILITHSQRCMGDHPLTCERGNAWEGRREHHTCGNNGRLKNFATVW